MSNARFIVGDVFDVLADMPDESVNCVITSPPYHLQRRYITDDASIEFEKEIGQEPDPASFVAVALRYIDELYRVLRDDGVAFINYGDKASGSGGAGGDYGDDGLREGQNTYGKSTKGEWPLRKSIAWEPEIIGASMAYGRNLLTGEPCSQWVTRPHITWCKPSPTPGACVDKFREATELIIFAAKRPDYWFDLDAIRSEPIAENQRTTWNQNGPKARKARAAGKEVSGHERYTKRTTNPKGAPPLNWQKVNSSGYAGAHFATFPPELIVPFVKAGCREGGVVLDPFGGSGTTGAVATGHGRDAILIDLDERNADLARERIGMFVTVEHHADGN